jgi:DNA-3-methyladenine glycosylase
MAKLLPRSFFRRDARTVARALLGQRLVRVDETGRLSGRIVETEAYLGIPDKAAHTTGGRRTERNASMWGDGGRAYIYFTYGMHHCFNAVAGGPEQPVAVLIRALEPEAGQAVMAERRRKAKRNTDLCSGPAKLCEALAIDRALDGADLTTPGPLFVEALRQRAPAQQQILTGPRVGVDYAGEWAAAPLRYGLRGSAHLSRKF